MGGVVFAICDLVLDVKTASGNVFRNMSDASETAICSFMDITHISEILKISRCWLQ